MLHRAAALAVGAVAVTLIAPIPLGHADPQPDRDALWHLVHEQCVPDQLAAGDPAPCVEVDLSGGEARGYAILKDRRGARQFLLIPTARITGTDDPALLAPWAPNYLAQAWEARQFTEQRAGGPLPRDRISLTVNSASSRSQDQLHIHIDCLRPDVHDALAAYAADIGPQWSPLPGPLGDHFYDAVTLSAGQFAAVNLFALAADGAPDQRLALAVVGAGSDDQPRFIALRHFDDPDAGDLAGAENLQDHQSCATG